MGLQDRDYYRESSHGWGFDSITPVVKYLIFANIAVFLAQIFITTDPSADASTEMMRIQKEIAKLYQQDRFNLDEDAKPAGVDEPAEKADEPPLDPATKRRRLRELQNQLQRHFREVGIPGQRVSLVTRWFELDTEKVVFHGQLWRLITHAFCHDRMTPWHILFNMLVLFWCGCTLESMYGDREFCLFYFAGILAAAFAYIGLDLYAGSYTSAIGASGAVMAVFMLYACHFPYQEIRIFWLVPIQIRWAIVLYILFDLHPVLLILAQEDFHTGVAHAAHLGGLAFGFFYWWHDWRLNGLVSRFTRSRSRARRRPRLRVVSPPEPEPAVLPMSLHDRVDDILRKVHEQGQGSLTDEERAVLQEASERLKRRRT